MYRATPGELLRAAKKAAAGHTIIKLNDESTQVFSDDTQDVLSFAFLTKIEGFAPTIVATVNVTKLEVGRSELELFFHRKGTNTAWIPSTEFETRKLHYETDLQEKLDRIDKARSALEILWEAGRVKHDDYYARQRSLDAEEHNARVSTLDLVHTAKMEDMAQMPRITFDAMDEAAEAYFSLVQKNLGTGGAEARSEQRAQSLHNCDAFDQQDRAGKVYLNAADQANFLKKCSDVRSGKLTD